MKKIAELKKQAIRADRIYVHKVLRQDGKKRAIIVNQSALDILATKYPDSHIPISLASIDLTYRDLHALIQCIAQIEIEMFGSSDMLADFLRDCVYDADFSELDRYYEITSKGRKQPKDMDVWDPLPPRWRDKRTSIH
jgi:hypothetical protein